MFNISCVIYSLRRGGLLGTAKPHYNEMCSHAPVHSNNNYS